MNAFVLAAWFMGNPPVEPELYPEYYDTLNEAGVAAVQHAYDRSSFYEYGGVILQTTNRRYRIQVPYTSYRGDALMLNNTALTVDYAGYSIVADYHIHPCMPYSHYVKFFSDADVRSNTRAGLVGYLGNLCTGAVTRFVPGMTKEDKCWGPEDYLEGMNCGSSGEAVGSIPITRKPVVVEIPGPKTLARGEL